MKHLLSSSKRLACCLAVSVFLAGCSNGFVKPAMGTSEYKGRSNTYAMIPFPGAFMGTAAQWNEDYAVSVNHVPYLRNVAHVCTTGCDLSFIKRKAKGDLPEWRSAVPGEKLRPIGTHILFYPVTSTGYAKSTTIQVSYHPEGELSAITDAPVKSGMSGGPIYAEEDGTIVGITQGVIFKNWLANMISETEFFDKDDPHSAYYSDRITYYMPYERIKKEWEIFQALKAEGKASLPNNVMYK